MFEATIDAFNNNISFGIIVKACKEKKNRLCVDILIV